MTTVDRLLADAETHLATYDSVMGDHLAPGAYVMFAAPLVDDVRKLVAALRELAGCCDHPAVTR